MASRLVFVALLSFRFRTRAPPRGGRRGTAPGHRIAVSAAREVDMRGRMAPDVCARRRARHAAACTHALTQAAPGACVPGAETCAAASSAQATHASAPVGRSAAPRGCRPPRAVGLSPASCWPAAPRELLAMAGVGWGPRRVLADSSVACAGARSRCAAGQPAASRAERAFCRGRGLAADALDPACARARCDCALHLPAGPRVHARDCARASHLDLVALGSGRDTRGGTCGPTEWRTETPSGESAR